MSARAEMSRLVPIPPWLPVGLCLCLAAPAAATVTVAVRSGLTLQEGVSFSGAVADVTDSRSGAAASALNATIDWGDGTQTAGTTAGPPFTVSGSHTYADEGSFTVKVTVTDTGDSSMGSGMQSESVQEKDALTGTPLNFNAVRSQMFSGGVATFANANQASVAGDFTAVIDWGDHTFSPGIVQGGGGALAVQGAHTYDSAGTFAVQVTLSEDAPGSAFAQVTSTASVAAAAGGCTPSPTTLCLNNSRFAVTATWRAAGGQTGSGMAVSLTSDTGYFWFFSPTNVEEVVKVLNGCSFNNHYWVFAGGLTNVKVTTTVVDTSTQQRVTYQNRQNTPFQPLQDTGALAVCP
jgi:PKD repeat protein